MKDAENRKMDFVLQFMDWKSTIWNSTLNYCQKRFRSEVEIRFSLVCFCQSRVSKHRRPGSQGQLRPAGSNSGSQVDQRKHPGLQRRSKKSDHFWLWCRSIVRQPAHPLTLLRRYVYSLISMHMHTETCSHTRDLFIILYLLYLLPCFHTVWASHQEHIHSEHWGVASKPGVTSNIATRTQVNKSLNPFSLNDLMTFPLVPPSGILCFKSKYWHSLLLVKSQVWSQEVFPVICLSLVGVLIHSQPVPPVLYSQLLCLYSCSKQVISWLVNWLLLSYV